MGKILSLVYGTVSYVIFFGTFLFAIWFVWNMNTAPLGDPPESLLNALLINGGFLSLFAVQHSVMARRWFKAGWTKIVPQQIERSTFVLITSFILLGMFHFWQYIPTVLWEITNPALRYILLGFSLGGFLLVLYATFLIDHFELFGLKQVWNHWKGQSVAPPTFHTPSVYRWTRHPLYLGFMIAFICSPRMTMDHLFFAIMTTGYMLVAIQFEEQDLIHFFGDNYRNYRKRVSMLIPLPAKAAPESSAPDTSADD